MIATRSKEELVEGERKIVLYALNIFMQQVGDFIRRGVGSKSDMEDRYNRYEHFEILLKDGKVKEAVDYILPFNRNGASTGGRAFIRLNLHVRALIEAVYPKGVKGLREREEGRRVSRMAYDNRKKRATVPPGGVKG